MDQLKKKFNENLEKKLDLREKTTDPDERAALDTEIRELYALRVEEKRADRDFMSRIASAIGTLIGGAFVAIGSVAQLVTVLNHEDGDFASSKALNFTNKLDLKKFFH